MEYAILGGLVGGVWLLLLWLAIVVWVYRDVRDRSRDLALQVLAVFVVLMFFPGMNIPGLALYLMLRPRETLEEAYGRSLEEEALLREMGDEGTCPSCRRFTKEDWQVCPHCQTQIKDECKTCGRLLSFNWISCPYCARDRQDAAVEGAVDTLREDSTTVEAVAETPADPAPVVAEAGTEEVVPYQH
jgi:RNA polymerase subunit RPABC4/transcription elongation factor Spt4